MQDLIEKAKEIQKMEIKLLNLENKEKQLFSELWLKTDFAKELDKPKPTEKDKTSWIRNNDEYRKVKRQIANTTAKLRCKQRIFDIYFANEYGAV